MTAHPAPAVARLGGAAPAHRGAAEPPYIHVHRTRTSGWQVVHVVKNGQRIVRKRRLEYDEAIMAGAAAARVNQCRLEVDQ